jgi:hypothetical protein
MRPLLLVVLLGGCFAVGGSGSARPAVTPMLSELPADPTKRDAILDQARQEPGPEHSRQHLPEKQRRAETTAATLAAYIGSMFSKTQNVTIGVQDTFDENAIVAPSRSPKQPRAKAQAADDESRPAAPVAGEVETEGVDLVPWVRLKK